MIPENARLMERLPDMGTRGPSRTFRLRRDGRARGMTDGLSAMKQAIYLILNTGRYEYPIYSPGYGSELESVFGMPGDMAELELERRIREALMWDDRIEDVADFRFERSRKRILCRFTAKTVFGDVEVHKTLEEAW